MVIILFEHNHSVFFVFYFIGKKAVPFIIGNGEAIYSNIKHIFGLCTVHSASENKKFCK